MPWVYAVFGIVHLSPFNALSLGSAYLVGRRFESKRQAACFSGLAAVAVFWVVVLTVFFLFSPPPRGQGDLESWLNLSGTLTLFSVPVFALAALMGSHVSSSRKSRAPISDSTMTP